MNQLSTNKKLIKKYFHEVWNQGNFDLAFEIISPEFKTRFKNNNLSGAEALIYIIKERRKAFSDIKFTIKRIIAEQELVFVQYSFTGKHIGEFWGLPISNKKIHYQGIGMFKIVHNKILGIGSIRDELSLLQQIGVLPDYSKDARQ
jgi:steroid delta-isomerase-like uncharacterized protein